jgi:predicted acetyltransferase
MCDNKLAIKLVTIDHSMQREHEAFVRDMEATDGELTPYSAGLRGKTFEQFVSEARDMEAGRVGKLKASFEFLLVGAHTYYAVDDSGRIVGAINVRHSLNDYLFKFGGHIGLGVRPSDRRRGIATRMLQLALGQCASIVNDLNDHDNRVLITCEKENIASAKTIVRCKGELDNEVDDRGGITCRYWIQIE